MKTQIFTSQSASLCDIRTNRATKSRLKRFYSILLTILTITLLQPTSYSQILTCKGGCTSNDVQIKRAYVKDASGNDVTCILGAGPATGFLYLELTTNTPRVGVSIQANIVDRNDTSEIYATVGECFGVTLNASTIVKFTQSISWTCGDPIALKDAFISWGTGNTDFCAGKNAPKCPATPSKCWRQPFGEIIAIELTPCTAATITSSPANSTICAGSNTTFSTAYTSGSGSTTIKWQRSTDGTTWTDITSNLDAGTTYVGYNSGTLSLVGSTVALNNYKYHTIITNTSPSPGVPPCSVSSSTATLTVKASPDIPTVTITAPGFCSATGTIEVTNPVAGYIYTFNYTGLAAPVVTTYIAGPLKYTNVPAGSNPTLYVSNGVCPNVYASGDDICPSSSASTASVTKTNTVADILVKSISEYSDLKVKAFPNPFNNRINFVVTSPKAGNGSLEVFNMTGQKIKTAYQGYVNAGENYFDLNLPSKQFGTLFYVLKVNDKKITGKIMQVNN